VLGVSCVVLGLVSLAAGAIIAVLFGSDGTISSAPSRVSGSGVAVIADGLGADSGSLPVPDGLGTLTVAFTSPTRTPVFVGTAAPADVDTYLTGAPYDAVVSLSPGSAAEMRSVPGTQQPAVPTDQRFWIRQTTGSPATLTAAPNETGTLVVMNADASPGVAVDVVVTLSVATAWSAALAALGGGAVLVLAGVVALWRAAVRRRRALAAAGRHSTPGPSGSTVLPAHGDDVPVPVAVAVPPAASNVRLAAAEPAVPQTPSVVDDPDPELAEADPSDADVGLAPSVDRETSSGG
jgi:hypothetical protein